MHLAVDGLDVLGRLGVLPHVHEGIDHLQVVEEVVPLLAHLRVEVVELVEGLAQHLVLPVGLFPDKAVAHAGEALDDEHDERHGGKRTHNAQEFLAQVEHVRNKKRHQQHDFYAVDDDGHGRGLVDIDVPIAQLLHLTPSNSPLIVPQTPALRKERARRTTRKTRRAPAALQRQNEQNTAKGPCFAYRCVFYFLCSRTHSMPRSIAWRLMGSRCALRSPNMSLRLSMTVSTVTAWATSM